jgi:AraC-like DNA-binding protein
MRPHEAAPEPLVLTVGYYAHRTCTPEWRIPPATTDFVDLTYIVDGVSTYVVDGVRHVVRAGDLLCVPRGASRAATTSPDRPMQCFAANVEVRTHGQRPVPLDVVTHLGLDEELVGYFRELWHAWVHRTGLDQLRIDGLLMLALHRALVLASAGTARRWRDPRVERAVRYVSEHFAEPVTVAAMAERAGLHAVYFAELFRRETGLSPRRYLSAVRIHHAVELLGTGEYSVRDVAAACGYADTGYFSRHFRELMGRPPREFVGAAFATAGLLSPDEVEDVARSSGTHAMG